MAVARQWVVRHSEALVKPVLLHYTLTRAIRQNKPTCITKTFLSLIPFLGSFWPVSNNRSFFWYQKLPLIAYHFGTLNTLSILIGFYLLYHEKDYERHKKAWFFAKLFVCIKKKVYLCTVIWDKCNNGIKERNVSLIPFLVVSYAHTMRERTGYLSFMSFMNVQFEIYVRFYLVLSANSSIFAA